MDRPTNRYPLVVLALLVLPQLLVAQVMNPADAQRAPQPAAPGGGDRLRSWELPAVDVVGQPAAELREEDRVGTYGQPRWTATRRFPTTRVYVVPEGKLEIEYWLRVTYERDGRVKYRDLLELEMGLPYRFQLDIYFRSEQTRDHGETSDIHKAEQVELRYALADWGVLPGNPTLYFEWIRKDDGDPDVIEPKLLLGGELASRWHWGLNVVAEQETGGEAREYEYSARGGLSYTVIDSKFSLGVESMALWTSTKEDRDTFAKSYLVGPSLQLRPFPQFTMNVAPLFGLTGESPDSQLWFNVGWEF